jgi:hypothetical protein
MLEANLKENFDCVNALLGEAKHKYIWFDMRMYESMWGFTIWKEKAWLSHN